MSGLGSLVFAIGGMGGINQLVNSRATATYQPFILQQPFSYIIYKENPNDMNSETIAQKNDRGVYPGGGTDPLHDPNPEVVIQKVLDDSGPPGPTEVTGPGHIYIRDGIYKLRPSFQGFNVKSYTHITLGPQALIRIPDLPNGFSGNVFKFEAVDGIPVSHCTLDGGIISEAHNDNVPPKRQWTAILLKGTDSGVFFNRFINTTIFNADTGVRLETHNQPDGKGGWVNGNSFQFLKMSQHRIFVDFLMVGPFAGGNTGINRNNFMNLECQSINGLRREPDRFTTAYGIKDIRDVGNSFIDVNIWDFPDFSPSPPQIPLDARIANITAAATGTKILGGVMTRRDFVNSNRNFVDLGKDTRVY
jgi:hypothetical protein